MRLERSLHTTTSETLSTTTIIVETTTEESEGFNPFDESSDVFFLVSVVAPLLFCCFAIFVCAINSIWKTRSKLQALTQVSKAREPAEYTEFTIDLTTKLDSCVELSSPQISSKEVGMGLKIVELWFRNDRKCYIMWESGLKKPDKGIPIEWNEVMSPDVLD